MYGTGTQVRCFGHVYDIANAIIKLMMDTPKAVGEIINLGSTEAITMNSLAQKIKKMTGSKSPIVHIPYKKAYSPTFDDMQKRVPDLSKAKKIIGYKPTYTLEEILRSMINQ